MRQASVYIFINKPHRKSVSDTLIKYSFILILERLRRIILCTQKTKQSPEKAHFSLFALSLFDLIWTLGLRLSWVAPRRQSVNSAQLAERQSGTSSFLTFSFYHSRPRRATKNMLS